MWSCWAIRKVLGVFEDGMIEGRRAQRVARHLGACASCQRAFVEQRRLTALLHSLKPPSRPPEYWAEALLQMHEKLEQQPHSSPLSVLLDYLKSWTANPAQALLPVGLAGMALFSALMFLGLEGEAAVLFTSYLLPIVLE
jgi:anti-sigma factor RsiW